MIRRIGDLFELSTKNTTYLFCVTPAGHLEHLYYGNRLLIGNDSAEAEQIVSALREKKEFPIGNAISYSKEFSSLCLEDFKSEVSTNGKGNIGESLVELEFEDGNRTSDFVFDSAVIEKEKVKLTQLPYSYDALGKANTLCITMREKEYDGVLLRLYYSVFEECDAIVRSTKISNMSRHNIKVHRLLSMQLEFDQAGYQLTTFHGAWAREMKKQNHIVENGMHVNQSVVGVSSNRANPFVMISERTTTEEQGFCIGCNLVYSGNHYESLSVSAYRRSRFVAGMGEKNFCFILGNDEELESPEAVFIYSREGFQGVSHHMHEFVREHIVRGEWKKKERPILLNSWEASYFDFTERKLLQLAKTASEAGIELFVLDDGWFGKRNDDTSSLGDWTVNTKKLPSGLEGLAKKIKKMGMAFGLWVEPEMVNVDSECYRKHPDWVLAVPGHAHSEGRNQRILDLTRKEVQEYIIEEMTKVFSQADISYVKWDMNRIFSDYYSPALPTEKQGEVGHRYVLGLYQVLEELVKRFPKILFEGCASGGNRFDLGMLCYMPQIWASDNTDAISRLEIQNGYSYGYPLSVIGAHVSGCPNHQTLRVTPLDTRFHVACYGLLGYEITLEDLKKEELEEIKTQIAFYKEWRSVLQFGTFYRLQEGNQYKWLAVSKEKDKALGFFAQKLVTPNMGSSSFRTKGLEGGVQYRFWNPQRKHNIKQFGDLVNTVSPIRLKQDSLLHNTVAKFVKMDGETEEYTLSGTILNECGVCLKQGFGGTGYNDKVRLFQDFHSRVYCIEKV